MKNKFEHFLLSLLLSLTVLMGLSFWMNTRFGFNIFSIQHWELLSKMQANQTPINISFYVSIVVAIVIFFIGIIVIYVPIIKHKIKEIKNEKNNYMPPAPVIKPQDENSTPIPKPTEYSINMARPPRLNLPQNMSTIIEQRNQERVSAEQNIIQEKQDTEKNNAILAKIFSDNGYLVKPNPTIAGITSNLFAIGANESLWIGKTDCPPTDLYNSIQKLSQIFSDTLEDIKININAFIIDINKKYNSNDNDIIVVNSFEELEKLISQNPSAPIDESNQESFDAYSEYIDTIIQYVKNV